MQKTLVLGEASWEQSPCPNRSQVSPPERLQTKCSTVLLELTGLVGLKTWFGSQLRFL